MHLLSVPDRGNSLQTFGDQCTVSHEQIVELDQEVFEVDVFLVEELTRTLLNLLILHYAHVHKI